MEKKPLILWGITDGHAGMDNQCLGLAEALNMPIKMLPIQKLSWPWHILSPFIMPPKTEWALQKFTRTNSPLLKQKTWPDIIFTCGRQSIYPSLAIKKLNKGKTFIMKLQTPQINPSNFDMIIIPEHDTLRGENIFPLFGAPHRVNKQKLEQAAQTFKLAKKLNKIKVTVLIGGPNDVFPFTEEDLDRLIHSLQQIAIKYPEMSFLITPSRRTPIAYIDRLKKALKTISTLIWNLKGENPYFAYLGLADKIIATGDSISMISEASLTEKPVYIFKLKGGSNKFNRFYKAIIKQGAARFLEGEFDPEWRKTFAFNETVKGAQLIKERLNLFFT